MPALHSREIVSLFLPSGRVGVAYPLPRQRRYEASSHPHIPHSPSLPRRTRVPIQPFPCPAPSLLLLPSPTGRLAPPSLSQHLFKPVSLLHKMATELDTHDHVTRRPPRLPVPMLTAIRKRCTRKGEGAPGLTKPTTSFSSTATETRGKVVERKMRTGCLGRSSSK